MTDIVSGLVSLSLTILIFAPILLIAFLIIKWQKRRKLLKFNKLSEEQKIKKIEEQNNNTGNYLRLFGYLIILSTLGISISGGKSDLSDNIPLFYRILFILVGLIFIVLGNKVSNNKK